jgi:integrase
MVRVGYDATVIPQRLSPLKDYAYTPYIFSERELGLVLTAVDRMCATGISTHSDLVFPLVFRMLVGCGTRITETLQVERKDIDLENRTVLLRNTKNGKQRIIAMAESLVERCRQYAVNGQSVRGFNSSRWFFPNKEGMPYSSTSAYCVYRKALRLSGISHGGKGKGPRLHDLRHTFAVRLLNRWVSEGRSLTTALPYLAIYMGHEGLKASQHYLRLTAVMFPELIRTVEKQYGWVIPEAYHE